MFGLFTVGDVDINKFEESDLFVEIKRSIETIKH